MSLQLWLPFNGDLKNKGLSSAIGTGASITYGGLGKTGVQCLKSAQKVTYDVSADNISTHNMSFSFWARGDNYTGTSTQWWQLCSFYCTDASYFHVYCVPNARYKIEYNPERNLMCDTSIWHHVTYVLNGTNLTIYLDGTFVESVTVTNAKRILSTIKLGCSTVCLNDFKLYDHCLTIQEVERDYASLLIHYPLRDPYVEGGKNLLPYPTPGNAYSANWDKTLHPNAISVSGWSVGYNGGVSNPATGYHAYWEVIDGIPTMVMKDLNGNHRWLGISSDSTNLCKTIGAGNKYTISFEARTNVPGKKMHSGLHYKLTSASSNNFNDGTVEYSLTGDWKKYTYTKTLSTSADIASSANRFYIYGHTSGLEGIVYVRNVQLELGERSTPYSIGTRSGTEIADCSGRGYDSVTHGALTVLKDSMRNSYTTQLTSNNGIQIPSPFSAGNSMTEFSISMWIYLDSSNGYMYIFSTSYADPTASGAGWFSLNTEGTQMWFYSGGTYWKCGSSTVPTKEWHHVGMTFKNGIVQFYYDGKPFLTPIEKSKTAIPSTAFFGLGDSYTGNSWSGAPFNGRISDFRFYGTAITADMMKELYENSATVDQDGNIYAYEFVEV